MVSTPLREALVGYSVSFAGSFPTLTRMSGPIRWLRTSWSFVLAVGKRWYFGGIGDLAAGVTFWILVTLPAAILAMVSALGSIRGVLGQDQSQVVEDGVVRFVEGVFSTDATVVSDTIVSLFEQQNSGLLTFSLAVAFWSISRGFSGLIRALDDVYEVEDGRVWYINRLVALVLGLGSMLISLPIVFLETYVWSRVQDGPVEEILRSLLAVLILVAWASLIFHFGSAIHTKWRWDLPGAVFAASFWWLLTNIVRFYVGYSSDSNEVLTTIGASLLALTWVWLAAQGLLIGAAVNTELGERLGLDRRKRQLKIPDVIMRTGEMRKIVIGGDSPNPPNPPRRR